MRTCEECGQGISRQKPLIYRLVIRGVALGYVHAGACARAVVERAR